MGLDKLYQVKKKYIYIHIKIYKYMFRKAKINKDEILTV